MNRRSSSLASRSLSVGRAIGWHEATSGSCLTTPKAYRNSSMPSGGVQATCSRLSSVPGCAQCDRIALGSEAGQLGGGGDERIAVDPVLGRELGGAVQLEDGPAAGTVREQIDADQVRAGRRRRTHGELERPRRRRDRTACRREQVRPPLPRVATREIAPTAAPAATTTRRSNPAGATSAWMTAPWCWNQGRCSTAEMAPEADLVAHSVDLAAPATETGLDDDRAHSRTAPARRVQDPRPRVGSPARCRTSAVNSLSCAARSAPRPVEHDDASRCQRAPSAQSRPRRRPACRRRPAGPRGRVALRAAATPARA